MNLVRDPITTVLFPADRHHLVDLCTVKSELSLKPTDTSNDDWLRRAIGQVSRGIARYCKRSFVPEQVQDMFDVQQAFSPSMAPRDMAKLQLSRWPVIELDSVKQFMIPGAAACAIETLPPGETHTRTLHQGRDFRLNANTGQLLRLNHFTHAGAVWEARPLVVVYTAGYAEIPEDLVEICLRVIATRFSSRNRDPLLVQQDTPGIGTQRWWFAQPSADDGQFPPDIAAMLDDYRVPTVA
ncbi:MAG TPA: hypothetical protein VGF02_13265 [Pseudolabrys sp.]